MTPADRIRVALRYIRARYHGKAAVRSTYWYEQGGYLAPGSVTFTNSTGRPIPVARPHK